MANKINANISCNTLNRAPIDCHVVVDVAGIGENGIVAGETTTFKFLWKIVVDTVRSFLVPPGAGVRRLLTFVNNLVVLAVARGGRRDQRTSELAEMVKRTANHAHVLILEAIDNSVRGIVVQIEGLGYS